MNLFRKNTREINRDEAFKIANQKPAVDIKELANFSKKFGNKNKPKDLIISRQVGLGDLVISRIGRKYFISDCWIH